MYLVVSILDNDRHISINHIYPMIEIEAAEEPINNYTRFILSFHSLWHTTHSCMCAIISLQGKLCDEMAQLWYIVVSSDNNTMIFLTQIICFVQYTSWPNLHMGLKISPAFVKEYQLWFTCTVIIKGAHCFKNCAFALLCLVLYLCDICPPVTSYAYISSAQIHMHTSMCVHTHKTIQE